MVEKISSSPDHRNYRATCSLYSTSHTKVNNKFKFHLQVDTETTESVVTVDWENGFLEASAKSNDNVNKVNTTMT